MTDQFITEMHEAKIHHVQVIRGAEVLDLYYGGYNEKKILDAVKRELKLTGNVVIQCFPGAPVQNVQAVIDRFKVKREVVSPNLLETPSEAKNEPTGGLLGKPAIHVLNLIIESGKALKSEIPVIRRIISRLNKTI